ncbi:family 2A encapsulin nanocompartment cargo protein cysteine desulfurase [Paraburkholderia sp. J67]|uniref:family 2A encapsulin nanocompartment cargo protein cysteine desulfurase n=1 Tax=Paraburkholderia sp. J67 TaxID=2805435 RepID=UPI002ABD7F66|nr:family 2A encapsulin nanocompartment cargo protein cysteine desulfurase [Paraburkholderia sp. J67]
MTMQTPIGNPGSAASGVPPAVLPGGLPDPAQLARLANAFFNAPPGGVAAPPLAAPPPAAPEVAAGSGAVGGLPSALPAAAPALASLSNPAPPGSPLAGPGGTGTGVPGLSLPQGRVPGANLLPGSPTHVLSLGNRAPALAPHAVAQNGLPDQAVSVLPALEPRAGGALLGVPQQSGANVPSASGASPFYFLDDALRAGSPAAAHADTRYDAPALQADPRAFGLPTQDDLRDLLPLYRNGFNNASDASRSSGRHYVLDEARAAAHPREQARTSAFSAVRAPFDIDAVRRDFPILSERVNGRPLVWLDNAATTHKPRAVIERLAYFYEHENSNIHRAAHTLAGRATDAYEHARETVQRFIGAASPDEIVFVRGTTEAINLIAKSWGEENVGPGDEIVFSHLEHHANIVPWQQLAARKGATLRVIPVDETGQVQLDECRKLFNERTKIAAVTQVSNALGTVVPVAQIVQMAHAVGAKALVDGAQSISHLRVDVRALDADFFVFSGHKIYGPTGIGVVYGKKEVLEAMPPWQGGGNMIADVTFERTVFQPPPARFEAGTGNIADAVGLGAALDYVTRIGIENIARYEHDLLAYATSVLAPVPGVRLVGTASEKASVLSFVLRGYQTEEVGRALSEEGIAVRSGHHCAQPILRRFGLEATVRPSLAFYNTCDEVDALVSVVRRLAARRA